MNGCDTGGHRLDYLTRRCSVCGLDEEVIIARRAKRELRNAKAAAKPVPVKLKGIVGGR